jgi:hypothetical protein
VCDSIARHPAGKALQKASTLELQLQQLEHDLRNVVDVNVRLLLSKHRDYGPTNISRAPGGALNGLRVRMHDKLARINHLIDNGASPENEALIDSFIDLANYATIAQLVIRGEWPND